MKIYYLRKISTLSRIYWHFKVIYGKLYNIYISLYSFTAESQDKDRLKLLIINTFRILLKLSTEMVSIEMVIRVLQSSVINLQFIECVIICLWDTQSHISKLWSMYTWYSWTTSCNQICQGHYLFYHETLCIPINVQTSR